MPPIIVADTGFVLSVAAVDGMPPLLGTRWAGRTAWPTDVRSELLYRDRAPGGGVPAGLARKANNSASLWLPSPIELSAGQLELADKVATALGGVGTLNHRGEAAAAVIALERGGVVATEDYKAAQILQSRFGVAITCISELLQRLHDDGRLSASDVDRALNELRSCSRPNVDGFAASNIISGEWKNRLNGN